jgi:hypothetical protein
MNGASALLWEGACRSERHYTAEALLIVLAVGETRADLIGVGKNGQGDRNWICHKLLLSWRECTEAGVLDRTWRYSKRNKEQRLVWVCQGTFVTHLLHWAAACLR